MLFRNVEGLRRMSAINNVTIPPALSDALEKVTTPRDVRAVAVAWGTALLRELLDADVPGVHLYTLNASLATLDVYANLGLGPV